MRSRLATIVIAAILGGPAALAVHASHGGQQGGPEPRVRVQPTVDLQQIQRERERIRQGQGRHEERETVSRTIRIGGSGALILSNLSGDITVTRGSGNDVQIEAVKIARGRDAADAREMLGMMRVDISERSNRVEVNAVYPSSRELSAQQRRQFSVSVVYNITAPAGTRLSAKSLSGDVRVTDIHGDVSAESTSGDISISNAERIIRAKTTSGDVNVMNSTSALAFEAQSISGDVTLRQVKAPRIQAGSISGNVIIGDVEAPRIDAQSISGDVEFAAPFAAGGRYDLNSHAGTIRIVVVGNRGFEIEATTFSGTIQADPSLNLKNEDDEPGRRRQRSLRAVHGDGSALIDATTFSGRVIVTKK
jgi:hypothetical protein